jgi:hypothetical protein
MKFIHALYFKYLPFDSHYDFFKKFAGILAAAGAAVKAVVAALMPELTLWIARADAVMSWVRKSQYTAKIAAADAAIDQLLVVINAEVEVGLRSAGSAIKDSALRVKALLKQFGYIGRKPYTSEEGDLLNLLALFQGDGEYAHDIDNLGMGISVQRLQLATNTFSSLLSLRDAEQVEKPAFTIGQVRKGLEEVYHKMTPLIDANAVTATGEAVAQFEAFFKVLNPLVDRLNEAFEPAEFDLTPAKSTVIAKIPDQVHTNEPVFVLPEVYAIDADGNATRIWPFIDFDLTFRNNIDVGTAVIIIRGKGKYTGETTAKFNIVRLPMPGKSTDNKQ